MNETLFYVLGAGLAALAVLTSLIGLRVPRFPGSKGAMVAIAAAFVLIVVATTSFAVRQSKDEERHREEAAGLPHATEEAEEIEEEAAEAAQ